jgi:AraC-like DNA-binding protein
MIDLSKIPIIQSRHPKISTDCPFEIVEEYQYAPSSEFHGDMHYALQFCIVMSGATEVTFDNFVREYTPGQAYWTMLWEPHAFRFSGRRNFIIAINIDVDYLGLNAPFGECNWLLPYAVNPALRYCPENKNDKKLFKDTGAMIYKLWNNHGPDWKLQIWLYLHQLILHALHGLNSRSDQSGLIKADSTEEFFKIKPAFDYVRKTTGSPLSLDKAAKLCSLSPSRFSKIFKEVVGISYGRFASRSRLVNATRDLMTNRETIDEISQKWGFFDNSHFSNSFKKFYGCSPRAYRDS